MNPKTALFRILKVNLKAMPITELNQLDFGKTYSYADYLTWQVKERLELLRGKIHLMSPAPNMRHQRISGNLHGILWANFKNHSCQVFSAPLDVRLPQQAPDSQSETQIYTVVQPDLCVVCDLAKLDEKGCIGAPDLMVEITSPGNTRKELGDKFRLYEAAGVKEYWIVSPQDRNVIRYVRDDKGAFIGMPPLSDIDVLETALFPGLFVDLSEVFGE